ATRPDAELSALTPMPTRTATTTTAATATAPSFTAAGRLANHPPLTPPLIDDIPSPLRTWRPAYRRPRSHPEGSLATPLSHPKIRRLRHTPGACHYFAEVVVSG